MKNPPQSGGVSSVEKKKSYGFSHFAGLPRHPLRRNSTAPRDAGGLHAGMLPSNQLNSEAFPKLQFLGKLP
jgi:hypothetical protein